MKVVKRTLPHQRQEKKHVDKVHLGIKNYICGYPGCGEAYETHMLLVRHQRENHTEFTCELCNKVFSTSQSLKQHKQQSHVIENKELFSCAECGKSFTKKNNLKTHIRSAHEGVTFDCEVCGSKFKHKHTLVQHKRKHEEREEIVDKAGTATADTAAAGAADVAEEVPEPKRKKAKKEHSTLTDVIGQIPPRVTVTEC